MNHKELKEYINNQDPSFLQDARHKGYVCPVCGNGRGQDGDGLTRNPADGRFHCFKCELHEDTVGLIGKTFHLDNFVDCLKKGAELYGVTLDKDPVKREYVPTPAHEETPTPAEPEDDFTDQYRTWNQAINEPGNEGLMYLQARGLSLETVNLFNIGYVADWKHPKTEHLDQVPRTPRVIIPTGPGNYLARDVRPVEDIPEGQRKYTKSKVGKVKLYNVEALKDAHGNVFLVEGEIDALSIIEAGGQAVGLGSASNKRAFLDYVKQNDPHVTFTILPDKDETGRKTAKELQEALSELNKKAYVLDLFDDDCKDANDALVKDRAELARRIRDVDVDPAFYEQYTKGKTSSLLQGLVNNMMKGIKATAVSTGFADLDKLLDGGLYEDLYILMAGTGHGKTALTLQLADTIAKTGRRVLFYNLEMANDELIARSISRETFFVALEEKDIGLALSARDVTDVSRFKTFTPKQKEVFKEAVARYKEYCDNVVFHEALGYFDTEKIDEEMAYYVKRDGKAPVVMLDYLQMLSLGIALNSDRKNLTERQAIDKAIYDLKSVSRKYKTTVFVLSSMNRDAQAENSNKEITQAGGKESGNIEYTAGTLFSLDYKNRKLFGGNGKTRKKDEPEYLEYSEPKEANKVPREMRLFIHKNRYGVPKQDVLLDYYSRYNLFTPPHLININ